MFFFINGPETETKHEVKNCNKFATRNRFVLNFKDKLLFIWPQRFSTIFNFTFSFFKDLSNQTTKGINTNLPVVSLIYRFFARFVQLHLVNLSFLGVRKE